MREARPVVELLGTFTEHTIQPLLYGLQFAWCSDSVVVLVRPRKLQGKEALLTCERVAWMHHLAVSAKANLIK